MNFLAIDGNSIMNRAFYGIKSLSNSSGQPTNAIYGFLNIFLKLINEIDPEYVAIAFDVKAPTFRSKQYDKYKATRHSTPNELLSQMTIIKKILSLMGYTTIEKPGFEADDILGSLSCLTSSIKDLKFTIVTGDKDSFQLIRENVSVKMMSTKFGSPVSTDYNIDEIVKQYNVSPNELIDVKALMGDQSDNVPGAAGIGEKTALSLISKYHNIENIYNNIETIDEKISLKNKLLNSKEMVFLSKDLVTICLCVPIDLNIDSYKISKPNNQELSKLLSDLEIFSIIKRLGLNGSVNSSNSIVNENSQIPTKNLSTLNFINNNSSDSLKEIKNNLKTTKNKKIYILFESDNNLILMIDNKIYKYKDIKEVFKVLLDQYKKNNDLEIYIHGAKKFHIIMLSNFGETVPITFDTEIAGYLLSPDSSGYELNKLLNLYCQVDLQDDLKFKMASFINLCDIMSEKIKENNLSFIFNNIELPLSAVLADMELTGVKLDQKGLILFGEKLDEDIEKLENEIYSLSGCEFNINSPKQLSKILFEELKLPFGKKTKTGYSTNAEVLEFLKDKHPIINKILDYRLLIKLKTTYVEGLLKEVQPDNRIHAIFNQTETKTGRISCEKPNMQNIPIKTKLGSELRKFFVSEPGNQLIDADYSQIELRILADFSNDKNMIEAFNDDKDIHTITASEIFNIPTDQVTSEMRSFAKSVNFGIIYGISSFSLAKDIGITVNQAKTYIDSYFEKFKSVKDYLTSTVNKAISDTFVTTLFGRKRYIKELSSNNKNIKAFGERIAKNTPIQGTAADIIKIAMINVYNKLKTNNLKSKLILQIHDELIIEAPDDEVNEVKNILEKEMQAAANLKVPLKVDIGTGDKWFDSH